MTTPMTKEAISSAMFSSLEGFVSYVVGSIESDIKRNLTDEEHQSVYHHVESIVDGTGLAAKDKRIAELELAQSFHDEGAAMLCGEYDKLAAAMGWTSELAEKQGVSQMEFARQLQSRAESAEQKKVAELTAATNTNKQWKPDTCPISGRPFFLWLDHPELGYVPTYGGPYDSFTLAEKDENGEFFAHRYDHDEGCWVDDEAVYLSDRAESAEQALLERQKVKFPNKWHARYNTASGQFNEKRFNEDFIEFLKSEGITLQIQGGE
ncbi:MULTISPECIES: hypothetical protein [Enterobacterales]|uniref:hypothetical protein n=1 Tax=Enterobacterales TaxID=91347 RepID=UPI002EDA9AC9